MVYTDSNAPRGLRIDQLFDQQVARSPQSEAVAWHDGALTYQALQERISRVAAKLRAFGVDKEIPVGVAAGRSLHQIVGCLAVLKAGGVYVPLDPADPAKRVQRLLTDSGIRIVLAPDPAIRRFRDIPNLRVARLESWYQYPGPVPNVDIDLPESSAAYIIYTSGSTGVPKGTVLEHRGLSRLAAAQRDLFGLGTEDRVLWFFAPTFDGSIWEIAMTLTRGATLVLPRPHELAGRALQELLSRQRVSAMTITPSALATVPTDAELPHLHTLISAGEALPQTLVDLWAPGRRFFNAYGPTETTVCAAIHECAAGAVGNPPIGRPLPGFELHVLDDALEPVAIGEPGELCIAGPALARGYLNRPELSAQKFVRHRVARDDSVRLYRTGDIVRHLPDGSLQFVGRSDAMLKLRGFRIEPGEIEAVLTQHDRVRHAVVFVHEPAVGQTQLVAYVQPDPDSPRPDVDSLRERDLVGRWERLSDEAYRNAPADNPALHTGGWNDSYADGRPLPVEQVQEWVDHTVEAILEFEPQRVLEVGCGTGMLALRIAPRCRSYCATDISEEGLNHIRAQLDDRSRDRVELRRMAAHELSQVAAASFDTVILNSVIQYFPGVDYLLRVLEQAVARLGASGKIFIGDVLSLPWLEAFHTSVELHKALPGLSTESLRKQTQQRIRSENRLMLDPEFFFALAAHLPGIDRVDIRLKRGRSQNELTRFRYDVTLHKGAAPTLNRRDPAHLVWRHDVRSTDDVAERILSGTVDTEAIAITQVPNARVLAALAAATLLASPEAPSRAGDVRHASTRESGLDPEDWYDLADEINRRRPGLPPYRARVTWSRDGRAECYDVVLSRIDVDASIPQPTHGSAEFAPPQWAAYANDPLKRDDRLLPALWSHLKQALPRYMLPASIVIVDSFPLAPSGKIDFQALPAPSGQRPPLAVRHVSPRTKTEREVHQIWSEFLHVSDPGVDDSFFDLGGHSLLLAELLVRIREAFDAEISLMQLLDRLTIAGIAGAIDAAQSTAEPASVMTAATVLELTAEAELPPEIVAPPGDRALVLPPSRLLLTGATGFLGAAVLEELLKRTDATIDCLVRSKGGVEDARERIVHNLRRYRFQHLLDRDDFHARVQPVVGDLSLPRLGLAPSEFDALGERLDAIYHIAASINLVYAYETLKPMNVDGCITLLELAAHTRLKPVHFVSTVGVFDASGYIDCRVVPENEPLERCGTVFGGYAQSKWVAEKVMRNARDRGLPVTIYRPAGIWAHSQTGASNTDDLLCAMIKQWILDGVAPDLDLHFEQSPVDYVARAIVEISLRPTSLGQTYHVVKPGLIHLYQLVESLNRMGYPVSFIGYSEWIERMQHLPSDPERNALGLLVHYLIDEWSGLGCRYLDAGSIGRLYGCIASLRALQSAEHTQPWIQENFMLRSLEYMRRQGYLPHPTGPIASPQPATAAQPALE